MTQIDVDYDKKFLKEKRKLQRKCPSLESDFEDFKRALIVDIKYNNYAVLPVMTNIFALQVWMIV